MKQGQYELEILVHGRPIREYRHEGQTFVEGRKGSEYKVKLRNYSSERVLAVVTVDGLSVMDGEEGDVNGNGYVLDPHSTLEIPGWRLDNEEVAKFQFGSKGRSYAAKIGRPTNVGVIGCAVFCERPQQTVKHIHHHHDRWHYWPQWTDPSRWSYTSADTLIGSADRGSYTNATMQIGSADNAAKTVAVPCSVANYVNVELDPNIGTEFGEATDHQVHEVSFDRQASPATVFELLYDDRQGLQARGIDLKQRAKVARPRAFPRSGRGCEPPRDWRR